MTCNGARNKNTFQCDKVMHIVKCKHLNTKHAKFKVFIQICVKLVKLNTQIIKHGHSQSYVYLNTLGGIEPLKIDLFSSTSLQH